jgi:hypothetical protein
MIFGPLGAGAVGEPVFAGEFTLVLFGTPGAEPFGGGCGCVCAGGFAFVWPAGPRAAANKPKHAKKAQSTAETTVFFLKNDGMPSGYQIRGLQSPVLVADSGENAAPISAGCWKTLANRLIAG